jgi:lipoprotein-anchoring transpeptidase ErfK/SrfK
MALCLVPHLTARAQTVPSTAASGDARDGVLLQAGVRSVRVLRAGEVIYRGPDSGSGRRGTAALGARLPALEAALGGGCARRWIRVGTAAWICQDQVELSREAPDAVSQPVMAAGEIVPFQYAFATYAGVRTYRRLEDVELEDWAEELEQGMSVALNGSARVGGRTFVRSVNGRWIALADLQMVQASSREGVRYEQGDAVTSVGFAAARSHLFATAEEAAGQRGARPAGFVVARAPLRIREEREVRRQRVLRTDGGWLPARAVRRPEVPEAPADVGATERWVDVDTRRQLLVAFEGRRPVYAALVSSGRPGHATTRGTFRVWVKLAASDMSNLNNATVDSATRLYSVARVPWVMFFHGDEALHGAYWHDQFGSARSHGCVNLAPRDARWLFEWAPPRLPEGWEAVLPMADDPGMRVRVR